MGEGTWEDMFELGVIDALLSQRMAAAAGRVGNEWTAPVVSREQDGGSRCDVESMESARGRV